TVPRIPSVLHVEVPARGGIWALRRGSRHMLDRRALQQDGEWEALPGLAPDPVEHASRDERMSTEIEEVVTHRDRVTGEKLLPYGDQSLLERVPWFDDRCGQCLHRRRRQGPAIALVLLRRH